MKHTQLAVVVVAACVSLALGPSPSSAVTPLESGSNIGQALEAIDDLGNSKVEVPVADSESPANLPSSATDPISLQGVDFSISVPGADALRQRGELSVLEDRLDGTTTVVSPTSKGVQVLAVLSGPESETSQTYDLDLPEGGQASVQPDGGVLVTDSEGRTVVTVAAPWAVDANGRSLPTHFTVVGGNRLIQQVQTAGAVFPVVADPSITYDCGIISCSAYLSRQATEKIYKKTLEEYGMTGPFVYTLMVTKLCARIGPNIAGVGCEVALIGYASWIGDKLATAARQGKCLRLKYRFVGLLNLMPYVDDSGFCKDS